MIIEPQTRDKQPKADSLSKKTEIFELLERLEEKQANQAEIRDGFFFWMKTPITSCHSPDDLISLGIQYQDTQIFLWKELLR